MPWFDCATRRQISANIGGTLSPNRGLVLHHQAGNGSLFGFFNSPSAKVSAHFWVSKSGVIEQYVDTNVVSWHGRDLNGTWVGVETEGCPLNPGGQTAKDEPMTEAMVAALARLYAEGARRHGWPNRLSSSISTSGFGFHRMAVNTACPCDVRLNMRTEILRRAFGGAATPTPPTPQTGGDMTAAVKLWGKNPEAYMACIGTDNRVYYAGPDTKGGWQMVDKNSSAKSGCAIDIDPAGRVVIIYTNQGGKVCTYTRASGGGVWAWADRGGNAR
jgi:hypothetical protein